MATATTMVTTNLQRAHHSTNRKNGLKTTAYTFVMGLLALYFLFPLVWLVISTTKTSPELFNSSILSIHGELWKNLVALNAYDGGLYWRWYLNSVIYATVTAGLSTLVSAMAGFGLAKYTFRLQRVVHTMVLLALLIPATVLAIPLFFVISDMRLLNSYPGVILPFIGSAFGVYFMRVYVSSVFPGELLDAGRVDGASDIRIFIRIAIPGLMPGLATLFLLSFVGAWNNFFFPLLVLSNTHLYPVTLGLDNWAAAIANPSATAPPPYMLVLTGSLVSVLPLMALFPLLRRYISTSSMSVGITGR